MKLSKPERVAMKDRINWLKEWAKTTEDRQQTTDNRQRITDNGKSNIASRRSFHPCP